MGWIVKIMGLSSGVSWVVYAVVFGLGVAVGATPAYIWEHRAVIAAEAQRDQYKQAADLAQQDAARWHARSDQGDAAMAQVVEAYKHQSDKVKEGRAREADMARSLADAAQRNRDLQQANSQLEQDLDAEVAKAPGDVRELGPIVAKRAPQLFN